MAPKPSSERWAFGDAPTGGILDVGADARLRSLDRPSVQIPKRRPYLRTCVNCGKPFRAPPSAKTRTCSADCSRRHRSRKHLDKHNAWADTSAARTASVRTGNLKHGTPAARLSRKAGPFESNVNAKTWSIISPDGTAYIARNLRLWCESNSALFFPHDWRRAYAGLRAIAHGLAGKRAPVGQWRGWRLNDRPS